jgi:hypothetical protein
MLNEYIDIHKVLTQAGYRYWARKGDIIQDSYMWYPPNIAGFKFGAMTFTLEEMIKEAELYAS